MTINQLKRSYMKRKQSIRDAWLARINGLPEKQRRAKLLKSASKKRSAELREYEKLRRLIWRNTNAANDAVT